MNTQIFNEKRLSVLRLCTLVPPRAQVTDGAQFLFGSYVVFVLVIVLRHFSGSGTIDREELKTVLKSSMEESSIQLPEERLDELTNILFEDADTDNSGSITFEELSTELEKHPGVLENLTITYECRDAPKTMHLC